MIRRFPGRADGFVVLAMADEQNCLAIPRVALHFDVHFGDEWASGVDFDKAARFCGPANFWGDTMSAL